MYRNVGRSQPSQDFNLLRHIITDTSSQKRRVISVADSVLVMIYYL
jgi:hypothetical protein